MIHEAQAPAALLLAWSISCTATTIPRETRSAVEHQIQKVAEATRDKDIEAYMSTIPTDLRILGGDGQAGGSEQLHANVLRDWSIIVKTFSGEAYINGRRFNPGR